MATDEDMGTADLLALIAPPFRLRGGPDFVLAQCASVTFPAEGATLWLQNPTNSPMPVLFWIGYENVPAKVASADSFRSTLAPLEVGALVVPISTRLTRPHTIGFHVRGPSRGSAAPRVRAATKGHLDRDATLKGIAVGVAGLALFGVGHFRVTHIGGEAGSSFDTTWQVTVTGPGLANAEATWTRIWAPADSPPTTFIHNAAPSQQFRTIPSRMAYGVILAALALIPFEYNNFASPFVGHSSGILLTLALFIPSIYGAHALLRAAFPGLYPTDTMGSLVPRDGNGIVRP
jgi:hypothetical protein